MQKENSFFFSFPNESTFDEVKGSANRVKYKTKNDFFVFISEVQPTFDEVKITKNWEKYQNNSSFSEYETTVASTGSIWEISFIPLP